MKQNKMEEQWLDEIRQTMMNHQEELPADGWEKIAAAMSSAEEVPPVVPVEQQPSSRFFLMWMKRAAAVVLFGAIGAGGLYYFSDSPEIPTDSIVSVVEESSVVEKESSVVEEPSIIEKTSVVEQPSVSSKALTPKPIFASTPVAEPAKEQAIEQKEIISQEEQTVTEPQATLDPLTSYQQEEQVVLLAMEKNASRKHSASRSWNVGVKLGRNGSADFDFENLGEGDTNNNLSGPDCSSPAPSDSTQEKSLTRSLTRIADRMVSEEVLDSENHTSWSFGISVNRQLNNLVSFESGLIYTYLSSDVEIRNVGWQHQQLHYIGIPLKINITFAEYNHWNFYTGAGTVFEHSLYGKRGGNNLHLNDWQWSMNGTLGLQYKLTDHVGLYVEPGINYYFSNGTEAVPSLRTESPFNFNLQIGVRFGL